MRVQLVVFDFDGTLADTRRAVSTVVNRVLHDGCLPRVDPGCIHAWMGLPLEGLLQRCIPPHLRPYDVSALVVAYRARFADEGEPWVIGYREAASVIEALCARGLRVAIATSREGDSTRRLIHKLGLPPFAAIASCERVQRGKPDPELLHVLEADLGVPCAAMLMVGDTTWDIEMARAAGVPVVAVAQGCHGAAALAAAAPDVVLDDLSGLLDLGLLNGPAGGEAAERPA
jgi:phosphoglycolate phosphatase